MSTQHEAERQERLIAAIDQLNEHLVKLNQLLAAPSPGWRRMLDEFKGAVGRIPTTIRTRF